MRATSLIRAGVVRQLFAYYGVAIVNTIFGYSLYALLVYVGLNAYAAQITSHLAGMTFNYFMYQRHVFRNAAPAIERYVLAYAANYGLNFAFLVILQMVVRNAYVSGLGAMLAASLVNFLVLKLLVFRKRAQASPACSPLEP